MSRRDEAKRMVARFKLVKKAILASLTDDLCYEKYKTLHPMSGFCYIAAECGYELLGGKKAGWKPFFVRVSGVPHWFLESKPQAPNWFHVMRFDPCGAQFIDSEGGPIEGYPGAIGKGFLTKRPSKRAQILIKRVKQYLKEQNEDL